MLKYYEYLLKIKILLKSNYNIEVLGNINKFPIKVDPSLKEYYEKIAIKINESPLKRKKNNYKDRYYIRKIKPFFVNVITSYSIHYTKLYESNKYRQYPDFYRWGSLPW